jgi:hypothetical protein
MGSAPQGYTQLANQWQKTASTCLQPLSPSDAKAEAAEDGECHNKVPQKLPRNITKVPKNYLNSWNYLKN